MTRAEMIKLAFEELQKSACNEIELEGAVADSNKDFRVRVVKYTPVPYMLPPYIPCAVLP